MKHDFKYIYGPVPSWRLGSSLGIDLLSREEKICSFDCTYCQLGRNKDLRTTRSTYVGVEEMLGEIACLPDVNIDYLTFSGRGEPTLAANLGEAILALKNTRHEKVAVITNSSLVTAGDVQSDLLHADFVLAKLDAATEDIFRAVNRPARGLHFHDIIDALAGFRKRFRGKFALQVMFTSTNKNCAPMIADIACSIGPDEVQINTPLRPCAEKPLQADELESLKTFFERQGLNSKSVYEAEKKKVDPLSDDDTLRRRGKEV